MVILKIRVKLQYLYSVTPEYQCTATILPLYQVYVDLFYNALFFQKLWNILCGEKKGLGHLGYLFL